MSRSSKVSGLKQQSSKDTAAVNALWKKHLLKCILPVFLWNGLKISWKYYGDQKSLPGQSATSNQKAYEHIEQWRIRPLTEEYPYIYVNGVFLKRSWGGEVKNVSILIAIGVNKDGYREILGAAEGMKEDK